MPENRTICIPLPRKTLIHLEVRNDLLSLAFYPEPPEMEVCDVSIQSPIRSLFCRTPTPSLVFSPSFSLAFRSLRCSEIRVNRMFILGLGFVGLYFASHLKKNRNGWEVLGTCTTASKKKKFEEMGFDVILFDANDPEPRCQDSLQDATHLLISIPPILGLGDPVLCLHQDLLKSELSNGNLQWLCYLSSTSVYGDCGGALVDEDYPITVTRESTKARLAAENGWLNLGLDLGVPVHVFRLGGIYGPGRSAVDTIIKQESLSKDQKMRESRQYTARIHVADICQALMASIDMPSNGRIYNVVDDDPAPRAEVFAYARALIKERWPGKIMEGLFHNNADLVIAMKNTRGEKRVSNDRLKKELGVSLLHPTYRSGLRSIIESMENPYK